MGAITRGFANNIGANGVLGSGAFNNSSLDNVTKFSGDAVTYNLLQTQTASSDSTISFTSGIDSTYDEYMFLFVNIHPQTEDAQLSFQANAVGGSGFNETITDNTFQAFHSETASSQALQYTNNDQGNGTAFSSLTFDGVGDSNDSSASGYLRLYNPSGTTHVKLFESFMQHDHEASSVFCMSSFQSGYFNTTAAIDEIQFKFSTGNIDSGIFKLYGVS